MPSTSKPASPKPVQDPTPHRDGQTTPHRQGKVAPRLPHERDESADSQTAPADPVIRQAREDLLEGKTDTDRGPVLDEVYEKRVRPAEGATRDRGTPGGRGAVPDGKR